MRDNDLRIITSIQHKRAESTEAYLRLGHGQPIRKATVVGGLGKERHVAADIAQPEDFVFPR